MDIARESQVEVRSSQVNSLFQRAIRHPLVFWVFVLPLLFSAATRGAAPLRGYIPRACGFDMNRNGIIGEPADCRVCNGTTTDPDSDGVNEDLIYIDCQSGTDSATCGAPTSPCRTINYAWNDRADGPGDGAEDILCFRGTCTSEENTAPGVSGVAGFYVRAQSGSEARSFELPSHPTMLVGWDVDADGSYPPVDNDVAVLDGGPGQLTRAFHFNLNGVKSYLEVAHFVARDYGRFGPQTEDLGFLRVGFFGPQSTHVYLHDLQLERINRGRSSGSSVSVFNFFRGGTVPQHWALVNLNISEMASWLVRGSGQDTLAQENGPFRFQNLTVTALGCSFATCGSTAATTMFKLWGYVRGVEILDSVFNLQPFLWFPGGNPSNGVSPSQCVQDWTIRNNEFIDFQRALNVEAFTSGFCDGVSARPVDDIVFDRNFSHNDYPWDLGDPAVMIQAGNTVTETIGDVTVSNNVFASTTEMAACLWSEAGNPLGLNPGQIIFAGNSCLTNIDRYAAIMIGRPDQPEQAFPQQNYLIKNNLIRGLEATDVNVRTDFGPLNWQADNNLFATGAAYSWNGIPAATLAVWRSLSADDVNSRDCTPLFRSLNPLEFHLDFADTCALGAGTQVLGIDAFDVEGQARGITPGWEIGADEVLPLVFRGTFAPGTFSEWSSVVPGS